MLHDNNKYQLNQGNGIKWRKGKIEKRAKSANRKMQCVSKKPIDSQYSITYQASSNPPRISIYQNLNIKYLRK